MGCDVEVGDVFLIERYLEVNGGCHVFVLEQGQDLIWLTSEIEVTIVVAESFSANSEFHGESFLVLSSNTIFHLVF